VRFNSSPSNSNHEERSNDLPIELLPLGLFINEPLLRYSLFEVLLKAFVSYGSNPRQPQQLAEFGKRVIRAVMSAVRLGFKNEAKTNPKYSFEAGTGYGTG